MKFKEIRSVTITEKGQIAIPKSIRKLEGFKEGAKIAIIAYEDRVELRSMQKLNEKLFPALATEKTLAKEWNTKEEDNAWKNL